MKVRNNEHDMKGPSGRVVGILVSIALLAVVVSLVVQVPSVPPAPGVSRSSSLEVSVRASIAGAGILDAAVPVSASSTVFDVLQIAAKLKNVPLEYKTYPGMGVLVTRIGSGKNGESKAYWQYWLNGVYAQAAADQTQVKPGDRVEWKFSDSDQ